MMPLPTAFCDRMQALLGEEYPAFLDSLGAARSLGLRVNPLRCAPADFAARGLFPLTPVPWCAEGFYYPASARPGKHALYEAGVYYIQEPSAMAAGAVADAKPGEWVLDLCAAPGGKTTHLAGRMQGQGILVANEIHPARAKILAQSVERAGICNAAVTNETPAQLAARFPDAFDCVVVDAPCSGEGMFRKDEDAAGEWDESSPALCAARQDEILDEAVKLVRPGGRLAYSTCTFSPEENEGTLTRLLARHPDFTIAGVDGYPWFAPGRPDWWPGAGQTVAHAFRLWPHRLAGEGHFCALLVRAGDGERREPQPMKPLAKLPPEFVRFMEDALQTAPKAGVLRAGDRLWAVPEQMPSLDGLRVLRTGLELGTVKKGRFEPAHAFALALKPDAARRTADFPADSGEIVRYLRGETLPVDGANGWTLVCADGFALGWGKAVNGTLKNHYPKGLRWK